MLFTCSAIPQTDSTRTPAIASAFMFAGVVYLPFFFFVQITHSPVAIIVITASSFVGISKLSVISVRCAVC